MVRKLSLMLVLTLGLMPLAAQALGLGNIKLNSALNQKFNAEIGLMSLAKGEIHDVKVVMASDEAFKRSGVDRTFLLTTLKFKPEQKADGTAIIKVTSNEPIREPFLNFLIEVNWPKGRLIREYTVLLDPPATLERKPAPIKAPKVAAQIPTPVAPAPVEATPAEEAPAVEEPSSTSGMDEVKVADNESLWVIARKHQYEGVDHTRMMMAIYNTNKQAFINSNINRLKKGAILRIPDKKDVQALSAREAQMEYKRHVEEWQAAPVADDKGVEAPADAAVASDDAEAKEPEAADAKADVEPEDKAKVDAEPKAEEEQKAEAEKKDPAAKESKPDAEVAEETKAEESESAPDAKLKIATARPEGEGEAGPSEDETSEDTIARLKQELLILEESAESVRSENEELTSRITELDGQLKDLEGILERLVKVRDTQLAEMQAALAKAKQEQSVPEEGTEKPAAPAAEEPKAEEKPAAPAAEEPKVEEKPAAPAAEEPKVEEKPAAPATEEPKTEEKPAAPATEEPKAEQKQPEPAVEEEKAESVVKPLQESTKKTADVATTTLEEEPEQGLFATILSSPTLLGITLAVIMVLIGLVWMLLSRKSASTPDFQESILLNTIDEEAESTTIDEANNIPAHTEETSFLSDFSPSDIDALQDETGEVDPLSEADVYIAYGRYQQAEELIRQAIEKEPERDALKHKLFEILYATKDAENFVSLVEESSGTAVETNDAEAWQRVLSMGKMLQPENPKFADAEAIDADDDLLSLDDDLLEDDLGESDFADLDETLTQVDFGDEADEKTPGADAEESVAGDELDDLDFDTNMDDDFISSAIDELEELDESLGEAEQDLAPAAEEEDSEFTLDLSDLEDEGEKSIQSLQDELSTEEDVFAELDDLDTTSLSDDEMLANEMEETSLDIPDMEPQEGDSELVSLGELDVDLSINEDTPDEVSTKLDLARAYIDMGDKDGASDILDE
jgi:pilus assembly protein FimV